MKRLTVTLVAFLTISIAIVSLAQTPADAIRDVVAPASQPVVATTQESKSETPKGVINIITDSKLGKILQGETKLTWAEVKDWRFWQDQIKDIVLNIAGFIPRFIGTMVFMFVFWLIYRGIRKLAIASMKKSDVDTSIRDMLATLIKWCVMGFGVVIACNQLGIPIVAMLTGVSIIGLAVGFAAQETLANFIAGIVIFLDKPFRVNDWVEVEGSFGRVIRVSFRSTRILTQDGEVLVFPNTHVLANKVANHSSNPINRVNIPIGIAYRSSIDAAREALLALTRNDARIEMAPGPEVIVTQCADSSVNLVLRFWIRDEAIERSIGYEYIEKAKKALDAAGIEIPFPHMQLFLENTPAIAAIAGAKRA